MISLEQVRQLDIRVKKAVTTVKSLSTENSVLKQQVKELEARLGELSKEATTRKADEEQLEVSLQSVLDVLEEVDSETSGIEPEPPANNDIIETVAEPDPDEEEVFFSPENSKTEINDKKNQTPEPPESEEPDSETTVPEVPIVPEPVTEEIADETEIEESEAELPTDDAPADSEKTDAETVPEKPAAGEEVSPEEPPEIINLDSEKEDEGFQSEFDIF